MGMPRLFMSPETAPKAVEFQCSRELFRHFHLTLDEMCVTQARLDKMFQCSSELFRYFHLLEEVPSAFSAERRFRVSML